MLWRRQLQGFVGLLWVATTRVNSLRVIRATRHLAPERTLDIIVRETSTKLVTKTTVIKIFIGSKILANKQYSPTLAKAILTIPTKRRLLLESLRSDREAVAAFLKNETNLATPPRRKMVMKRLASQIICDVSRPANLPEQCLFQIVHIFRDFAKTLPLFTAIPGYAGYYLRLARRLHGS
jgi:hypothetical protein